MILTVTGKTNNKKSQRKLEEATLPIRYIVLPYFSHNLPLTVGGGIWTPIGQPDPPYINIKSNALPRILKWLVIIVTRQQ